MTEPDQDPKATEPPAAPEAPAAEAPAEPVPAPTPEERIAALEAQVAELKDRALRAMAETENTRRRFEREREEAVKYAAGAFARDILSVADNLRRAIESAAQEQARGNEADEALKHLMAGVEVTERELLNVFERHGIQRIEALGQRFDANLHQAMFEIEDPARPAGTVVQVIAQGFTIAGRLLRAAMVGVSKGGPAAAKAPANDAGSGAPPRHVDTKV